MVASFVLNNLKIIVAVLSVGGMGLYYYSKGVEQEDMSNDLTDIIIEHQKSQKDIRDKIDGSFFLLKK